MKKAISIFIIILMVLYGILSILGSKGGGEYAAEVLLYRAMKANSKILINPDVVPPTTLSFVESNLQKILSKYPYTGAAKKAGIVLAEFYIANRQYDKSLATTKAILEKYATDTAISSTAQFMRGLAYEKRGDWASALGEYRILRDHYRNTPLGMEAPLYIGNHYASKGDSVEADKAYNEAVLFYTDIINKNKGKATGYMAYRLLVRAHLSLKEYESAGRAVEDVIDSYPSVAALAEYLPYVEAIYINSLNRADKAIEIYKRIKEKSKDEKLKQFLQDKIDRAETKK